MKHTSKSLRNFDVARPGSQRRHGAFSSEPRSETPLVMNQTIALFCWLAVPYSSTA